MPEQPTPTDAQLSSAEEESKAAEPDADGAPAAGGTGAAVTVTEVVKAFPLGDGQRLVAVDGVSLTLAPGSLTALTGPSGSGKSTLLHLIGAIERADSGSVKVDELELVGASRRRLADYRRSIGFVFQRFHLLPALTALDNVLAPVLPLGGSKKERAARTERARELLDAVGLAGRESSLPSRLSGGQQQRVAIARALINRPRLLLADEPTGNLDSRTGSSILELLVRLRAELGVTVVMTTHDPGIAAQCEQVLHLSDGVLSDATQAEAGPDSDSEPEPDPQPEPAAAATAAAAAG